MAARPTIPAPFHPGDRATAPMALEENTESAWARVEVLQKGLEAPPETAPEAPAKAGDAYAATVPMSLAEGRAPAAPRAAEPAAPKASLDEVMLLARRNNRACPLPAPWAALHALLPPRPAAGRSMPPPPPVDGPAWGATSAMQKRLRLRDQIEWADRAGVLQEVFGFLSALPEEQWHHFGE